MKPGVRTCTGKTHRIAQIVLLLIVAGAVQLAWADDDDSNAGGPKFSPEAAATFNKRCTACHTYGKGPEGGSGPERRK